MNGTNLFKIALRALANNKLRAFLTMLGIIIGVASVITMLAIGQGSKKSIQAQISEMGSNMIMIHPGGDMRGGVRQDASSMQTLKLTDYEALRDETNFLAAVSPNVSSSGQLIAGNNNYPASVNGVGTEYLDIRQLSVESGEMFTEADIQNAAKVCIIGKTISVEQLEEEGFKGVFVASGAGLPNFMNIPGENSINILSSNEYLTRVNLMDAASEDSDTPVPFGKNVAVIGGGNTAMDSVRTARRLGAERAMIIYRRSEEEMPARIEEVKHAKEEGVEFLTLHNPIEYIADELGKVKQVILQKMELGEPDASGRRSPVAIPGATETIDIDLAIVSVGVSSNPIVPSSIPGLEMGRKGTIAVNENMQSSIPTIYAGGDIVRGGATVILAMGDGRKAAAAMHEQLSK